MNPVRRSLVAALLSAPLAARAQSRNPVLELNPPLQVDTPGKIEVIEFFRYACGYCYQLQSLVEPWIEKLPSDVQFRRVPAVFNNRREAQDASIFYAFEALGLVDKLHRPLFDAIHRDRLPTDNGPALGQWLTKQGVDAKKFEDTTKSFGVQGKVRRANRLTADYQLSGTPAMSVHGRYMVSADGGHAGMLETVNQLVAAVRKHK